LSSPLSSPPSSPPSSPSSLPPSCSAPARGPSSAPAMVCANAPTPTSEIPMQRRQPQRKKPHQPGQLLGRQQEGGQVGAKGSEESHQLQQPYLEEPAAVVLYCGKQERGSAAASCSSTSSSSSCSATGSLRGGSSDGGGGGNCGSGSGSTSGKRATAAAASAAVAKALLGLTGSGQIGDQDSAVGSVRPRMPPLRPQSPTQTSCGLMCDVSMLAVAAVRKAAAVQAAPPRRPAMAAAANPLASQQQPSPSAAQPVGKLATTRVKDCETGLVMTTLFTGAAAVAPSVAPSVAAAAAPKITTQLPYSQIRTSHAGPTQIRLSQSSSSSAATGTQRKMMLPVASRTALGAVTAAAAAVVQSPMPAAAAATTALVNATANGAAQTAVSSAAAEDGATASTVATVQRPMGGETAAGGNAPSLAAASAAVISAINDKRRTVRHPARIDPGLPYSSGPRISDDLLPLPLSPVVPLIDMTTDGAATAEDVSSSTTELQWPMPDVSQASGAEAAVTGATVPGQMAFFGGIDLSAAVAAAVAVAATAASAVEGGSVAATVADSVADTVAAGSTTALLYDARQRRMPHHICNTSSKNSFDYDRMFEIGVSGDSIFGGSNLRGFEGEYEGDDDDESCFVCLERRSQLAFVHASGVLHVGICRACLPALQARGWARTCPLCRQDVTAMRELHL
ncbi:hypothetical protein Vafri_10026, partial [Volvox africanus]